jgi:hypothetical protein
LARGGSSHGGGENYLAVGANLWRRAKICRALLQIGPERREAAGGHGLKDQLVDLNQQENRRALCYFVCMSEASIESDGIDLFVVYNGVRIAKRGQPNSPQAGTWVSLEPSFRVFDKGYPAKLVIERDGKIISH